MKQSKDKPIYALTGARKARHPLSAAAPWGALMLTVCLAACVSAPPPAPVVPPVVIVVTPPKPIALTLEADNALKAAEQTVIEMRVKRALWTAATEQLDRARAAAKVFDSDLTLKHAREAISLCQLSLRQKQSPPVVW